jgi:hypothetical protein
MNVHDELVMITYICLGHIICTFEESTKDKICIFQLEELLKNCLDQNQTMKCISSNTI